MELLAAAIAAALLLLWGGIVTLLRLVPAPTPRHIIGLGAYATLVVGAILGLVLYTLQERQREHRFQLEKQMDTVTHRLDELSGRLVQQLEDKADLTASEFEFRARLQREQEGHQRTQQELAQREELLAEEEQRRRDYQSQTDRQLQDRFQREEERFQSLRGGLDNQRDLLESLQRQLAAIQQATGQLAAQNTGLQRHQEGLAGKLDALGATQNRQAQQLQGLQVELEMLSRIRAEVDSLYFWKKK
ncbi:MAG: hypothetical protein HYW07_17770 [Candidatus Latescibacteria bacterium]|nr:hypothetical protein [Candidatus Latescibacterota bacterium]